MKRFEFNRKTAKPEDFYFYAAYSYDWETNVIIISPIAYWNERHCVYDQHLGIYNILPEEMGECNEAMFDTSLSIEEITTKLRERGFKESESFSKWCQQHDPFCYKPDEDEESQ